jgi:hypothetical protein
MPKPKRALISLTGAVLICGGASAAAAPAHHHRHARGTFVSGRLGARGYTVVAVGSNGKVAWSKARSFSLRTPTSQYTLQLINSHGQYAGPVVVGGGSRKVVVGLHGAVKLGAIAVIPSKGYARVVRRVHAASLVRSRWAWAKRGVPIGNGRNFGLVVSPTKGTGPSGPGGDSDRSGIPNEFDIASGGNGVIKSLAPAGAHFQGHLTAAGNGAPSTWMSQLFLPIDQTVNDDASGVSQGEIDTTLQQNLNLKLLQLPAVDRLELDCNGLSFCSPGGTGQAAEEGQPAQQGQYPTVPFPAASHDPSTGFGELIGPDTPPGLIGTLTQGGSKEFSLFPNATSSQIGSGDVITELDTSGGTTTQTPTTVEFVFGTVPAIASYDDGQGDAATISYPDSSGLGGMHNPIPVAPGPDGHVRMTFTLYRPQRAGIAGAGEPAFMDIGHLWYAFDSVSPQAPGQTTVGQAVSPQCSTSDYSGLSSTLTNLDGAAATSQFRSPPDSGMLVDSASDQPASAANTMSFTVDVTACMSDKGQTFPVGQPVVFDISANSQSSQDHSNQKFWLQRTR